MMRIFKSNKLTQLEYDIKESKLVKDCFSMKQFNGYGQMLTVMTCYAIAAAVLPPLLSAIITPLSCLLATLGALALIFSYVKDFHQEQAFLQKLGLTLLATSPALFFLKLLLPLALSAALIYRSSPFLMDQCSEVEWDSRKIFRS